LILTFVLEVWIFKCVHPLPLTQLCHRIQISHISLFF
jgi:hypothetical protein